MVAECRVCPTELDRAVSVNLLEIRSLFSNMNLMRSKHILCVSMKPGEGLHGPLDTSWETTHNLSELSLLVLCTGARPPAEQQRLEFVLCCNWERSPEGISPFNKFTACFNLSFSSGGCMERI